MPIHSSADLHRLLSRDMETDSFSLGANNAAAPCRFLAYTAVEIMKKYGLERAWDWASYPANHVLFEIFLSVGNFVVGENVLNVISARPSWHSLCIISITFRRLREKKI